VKDLSSIPSVVIVQLCEVRVALPTGEALGTEFSGVTSLQLLGEDLVPDLAIEGGRATLLRLEDPLHGLLKVLSVLDGCAEFISVTFQIFLIEAWGLLIHHALISSI
jgi:hypothetical protein